MTQNNFGFVQRTMDKVYTHKSNEEVEQTLKSDTPHYDPCDTTLASPYDTHFKNQHSDTELSYKGNFCLDKPVKKVIKDRPFTPPDECCCVCVKPEPEKLFKRPTGEGKMPTHTMIPCDSRVPTIVSGHYALAEVDAKADEYFGKEITVEGEKETTNFVVSQPNTNPETTTNSVGYNNGTPVIEGSVSPVYTGSVEPVAENGQVEPL